VNADPDEFLRITPSDLVSLSNSCSGLSTTLKFDQPQRTMYYTESDSLLLVDTSIVNGRVLQFSIRVFAETQIENYPEFAFDEEVDVEVSICIEQASLEKTTLKIDLLVEQTSPEILYLYDLSLPGLFITIDETCTVFEYEVTSDSRGSPGPTSTGSPIFYVDKSNNTLALNTTLASTGKQKIYIHTYSVSGKTTEAYKALEIDVELDTNKAPSFESQFPASFEIAVSEEEQLTGKTELFEYKSSKLVDEEGNKPVMTVSLPIEDRSTLEQFLAVKLDSSAMVVTVSVDTKKIKASDAGSYTIIFIMADDGPTPRFDNYFNFKLVITYEALVPSEPEGEGAEEDREVDGDAEAGENDDEELEETALDEKVEEGEESTTSSEGSSTETTDSTETPEDEGSSENQEVGEENEIEEEGPSEEEQKAAIDEAAEEVAKEEAAKVTKNAFPGIDPAQLQFLFESLKRKNKMKMEKEAGLSEEEVEEEEAKIKFAPASSDGLIEMTFSQKLLAPSDISKVDYSSVFEVYLISAIDGSKVYPALSKNKRQLALYDTSASGEEEETTFEISFDF